MSERTQLDIDEGAAAKLHPARISLALRSIVCLRRTRDNGDGITLMGRVDWQQHIRTLGRIQ